jgi:hypothetical protein
MTQEDPRELARRLAEEAKRRMASSPPPAPAPQPDPVDEDADDGWAGAQDDGDGPDIRMAAPPPVGERAGGGARQLTAMEALAAAREAEKNRPREPEPVDPPAGEPDPDRSSASRPADRPRPVQQARSSRPGSAPLGKVANVVGEVFAEAVVEPPSPVENADVFRGTWKAHRARAVHDGDIQVAAAASVLIDAVDRVPAGWLVACRVSIAGKRWAVWVDLDRGTLLAAVHPADLYLSD